MKVAIVGATGETGRSIVDGLLQHDALVDITALIRPSSLEKPAVQALRAQGIKTVSADLDGPQEDLVKILQGIDVVICAIYFQSLDSEIPLSTATKAAGVERYVPCFFATVSPRGVMRLRDKKEGILDHIQRIRLPYTAIDVGWWFQISLPRVPSGRFDYALLAPNNNLLGGGDISSALTDLRDIGLYVAHIVSDPRTLNKKVFAFTQMTTQNQMHELVERLSGEKLEKTQITGASMEPMLAQARTADGLSVELCGVEYWNSWGIRGDNNPEYAKYLGYLLAEDLYPGLKGRTLESYVQEVIDGKARKVLT